MAVLISTAMAPSYSTYTPSLTLHGPSRLSRGAMLPPPPPPPPTLAKKDELFTEEEFQTLMSGQCELLSFSDNDLQSPSPLVSLQLQAQLLCMEEDEAYAPFQEPPPRSFALDDDLDAPISDEDIERLAPLFCDEEIQALCAAPQEAASSMQFTLAPRPDDHQAGRKRMPSSPPWPSCIADDDDGGGEEAGPPLLASLPPPPTKKARTQTKRRCRLEHGPPALPPPPPPINKAARFQTKSRRTSRERVAAARRLRHNLRKWHNMIATRILMRKFRAPRLSRGRTALRCQCAELVLEPRGFVGCCALHQEALPEDMAWMYSAQGHGVPPLVGWPDEVLVPALSAGSGKTTVLQYARWRRSVTLPTRFYVQRAVEEGAARSAAA